jgi:hypothetical protein
MHARRSPSLQCNNTSAPATLAHCKIHRRAECCEQAQHPHLCSLTNTRPEPLSAAAPVVLVRRIGTDLCRQPKLALVSSLSRQQRSSLQPGVLATAKAPSLSPRKQGTHRRKATAAACRPCINRSPAPGASMHQPQTRAFLSPETSIPQLQETSNLTQHHIGPASAAAAGTQPHGTSPMRQQPTHSRVVASLLREPVSRAKPPTRGNEIAPGSRPGSTIEACVLQAGFQG